MEVTTLLYGRKAINEQWCIRWRRVNKKKKKMKKKEVERYKPRMVQLALGINWDKIFALVSCLEIITLIITRIT